MSEGKVINECGFNLYVACSLVVTIFTLHRTFPHSCLYLHQSLGDLGTPLSLHIFQLLLIAYSGIALHSTAQQCTVCLLMHSLLTYAQHAYLHAAFLYSI